MANMILCSIAKWFDLAISLNSKGSKAKDQNVEERERL